MMLRERGLTKKIMAVSSLLIIFICFFLSGCGSSGGTHNNTEQREEQEAAGSSETQVTEWFYDQFDEAHRNAYDAFRNAVEDPFSGELTGIRNEKGESVQIAVTELDSVYQGFLYDHPELFWLDRTYRFRLSGTEDKESADAVAVIPLYGSAEEIELYNEKFFSAANGLLSAPGIRNGGGNDPGMIYDLLAGHAAYTEEALYDPSYVNEHTAYGAIVEKSAVCDGYALALKYLMDRCGIECIVVPGSVNGAAHVWNTAFWDGTWHEMDITWDASEGEDRHYFDLTTEEMERDHSREPEGIGTMIPVSALRDGSAFRNQIAV